MPIVLSEYTRYEKERCYGVLINRRLEVELVELVGIYRYLQGSQ